MKIDRKLKNRIAYTVLCIRDFGATFGLTPKQAHAYLSFYKGMDFMDEFYDVEHTLSIKDAIDDMAAVCKRHGGHLG